MSQNLATKTIVGKIVSIVGLSAWVCLGLFGFSTAVLFVLFQLVPEDARGYITETTSGLLVLTALQYVVTLVVVVGIPLLIRRWVSPGEGSRLRKILGIEQRLYLRYALIVPLVWAAYFITSNLTTVAATFIIPGFDVSEVQDVGFSNLTNINELALAFIALVILAPIAEELLFRGYLFGKLRALSGFWPSAIITSLVFGIAHMQWNVGIDVFVLSIFLCYLREKSGSVWSGVLLHGFKNSIAYFILFVAPLIGINLQ